METTQHHEAPALNSHVNMNGRDYKVIYSAKDSANMCSLRKGYQSFTLGLEGTRGAVYMANFCTVNNGFFGKLCRV